MNPHWRQFLQESGAVVGDDRVEHFGNPLQELQVSTTGSTITDLSHRGLIRARGADAAKFLQGQFTNDITRVDLAHSQLSGYCNSKGRLIALLRVFQRGDCFYLQLPHPLVATALARLKKYILMSKVTLEDASDELVGVGLAGPRSEEVLRQVAGAMPRGIDEVTQCGEITVIRLPGIQPRFSLHGPVEAMEKTWSALDAQAAPAGADVWTRLDILAGIPDIHPSTAEEFIPQTVNLELLGAISFDKGCYAGQEIIARLHYRGSVKRRMFIGHSAAETLPQPGTPLHATGDNGQAVGHIVAAAPDPDGGCHLLAVVAIEHWTDNTLYLHDNPETRVTLQPPAYLPAPA